MIVKNTSINDKPLFNVGLNPMKFIFTLLLIGLCNLGNAQSMGSKVSFEAADGKTYAGKIIEIEGDKYKIKYDGFEFESWMLKTQFTVTLEMTALPAALPAPSPELPQTEKKPIAEQRDPQPTGTGPEQQEAQNPLGNSTAMTRADSLKMAIADMKKAFEAAGKLFAGKSDTLTIVIPGIDYENLSLARLKESLSKLKGTRSVMLQYSGSTARLEVAFKGKTEQLWDSVPSDIRMMFKLVEADGRNIKLNPK